MAEVQIAVGLQPRQLFPSLEAFKSYVREISIRQHWDLSVKKSNRRNVTLGCRSAPSCPFRVVCRANRHFNYVSVINDVHTCRSEAGGSTSHKSVSRSESSRVGFLVGEIMKFFDINQPITARQVVDTIKRFHGYDVAPRQAQRALNRLEADRIRGELGARGSTLMESLPPQPSNVTVVNYNNANNNKNNASNNDSSSSSNSNNDIMNNNDIENTDNNNNNDDDANLWSQNRDLVPIDVDPGINLQANNANPQTKNAGSQPSQAIQPQRYTVAAGSGTDEAPDLGEVADETTEAPPRRRGRPRGRTTRRPVQVANSQVPISEFKIEFTCVCCGAANTGVFPNVGRGGSQSVPPVPTVPMGPLAPMAPISTSAPPVPSPSVPQVQQVQTSQMLQIPQMHLQQSSQLPHAPRMTRNPGAPPTS